MRPARPFDVLFLTNFSDSCFRAIPALAQLSDDVDVRLTILHAYGDDHANRRQMETNLRSFFPEADDYAACRRVLVPGSPYDAVRRIRAEHPVDLLVVPARDPLGLPRLSHRALRSRLAHQADVPMWTMGPGASSRRFARHTKHVACCLEVERPNRAHLRLACEYAQSLGATLHLIHVLPDIHEGSLLQLAYTDPLDREHATAEVRRVAAGTVLTPEVHITDRDRLPQLLQQYEADVVFLDSLRWMRRHWFPFRLNRAVDLLPCPSICIDATREDVQWSLPRQARASRQRSLTVVGPRPVEHAHASSTEYIVDGEPVLSWTGWRWSVADTQH